jgi:hypothetical protein
MLTNHVETNSVSFRSGLILALLPAILPSLQIAQAFEPFTGRARLERGGEVSGLVLDADDRRAIIEFQGIPTAVVFADMELSSAFQIRKRVMVARRGWERALTAEDHIQLGMMAWSRGHRKLSQQEFDIARRKNKRLAETIDALGRPRRITRWSPESILAKLEESTIVSPSTIPGSGKTPGKPPAEHRVIYEAAKTFGQSAGTKIGTTLHMIETDHFLIWTDWPRVDHDPLAAVCEQLYLACARQFSVEPTENIFAGKCSVFCFETRAKFLRFAREFDNYRNRTALAYTKTLPNGYARVAGYRTGATQPEMERFLSTLTHECVHAFVHRYRSSRSLPPWVSEGLANLLAARALGDFCPYEGDAAMVAKQIALRDIPISKLFRSGRMPTGQEYTIAHSLLSYLAGRDAEAFVGFINDLKDGRRLSRTLEIRYGETLESLESKWRSAVRAIH